MMEAHKIFQERGERKRGRVCVRERERKRKREREREAVARLMAFSHYDGQ